MPMRVTTLAALFALLSGCGDVGLSIVGGESTTNPPVDASDATIDADASDVADVSDARGPCRTDNDCVSTPATPLCNTATGRCVECHVDPETCSGAQHCHPVSKVCIPGCHDDSGCTTPGATHCLVAQNRCVECTTNSHCSGGMVCVGNACVPPCSTAGDCASGRLCCMGGCVDATSNVADCGRCGAACPAVPNATPTCGGTPPMCGRRCRAPFADCDANASNGCEVDTYTDALNCGGCGRPCAAGEHCEAGTCQPTCPTPFTVCDRVCVNTGDNIMHCGACGRSCPNAPHRSATCTRGMCSDGPCDLGWADCDGSAANGCETPIDSDIGNCGACGARCTTGGHSMASCMGGLCIPVCDPGFGDCNTMPGDGCEVDTRVTPTACGACGRACPTGPHATATCAAGACGIVCEPGFADCNMMVSDGCEVDLRSTVSSCGMCGRACTSGAHSTPTCAMSACGLTCEPGFANCNMLTPDGCEIDTRTDVANCGACSNRCMLAHATPTCAAGACAIMACEPNYADCDRMAATGCEANLQTDNANCGACGRACAGGAQCNGGYCNRFPSNGSEGPFMPTRDTTLPPGLHNYTTITIPAGVTVRSDGNGPLDLRATGPVVINGVIDVSGGDGGRIVSCNSSGSSGGTTGGAAGATNAMCAGGFPVCGGAGGGGGVGSAGLGGALTVGGSGGNRGGGGGGGYLSSGTSSGSGGGGGGGGFAGGGGGAGAGRGCGAALGSGGSGGAGGGLGGAAGGSIAGTQGSGGVGGTGVLATNYSGTAGLPGGLCSMVGSYGAGGGGGSIGADAAGDLAVDRDTFRAGSGGGGGGGPSGGGGGGGGGAIRLASPVSITIGPMAQVLARGGNGAQGNCGGGGGGGGSGGIIYLYGRAITTSAGSVIGADAGGGGFAVAGGGPGGNGGLGRIRISVLPTSCVLTPVFTPTVEDHELCALTPGAGVPGQAYLRAYPD